MTPEELAKVKVDLWINIENLEREIRDVRTRFRAIITGDGAAMATALAESKSIADSKRVANATPPAAESKPIAEVKPAPAAAKAPKVVKTAPPPPPPSTTTAAPPATTTQDDGLGALDEGPAITMDDLIKASVAAVKAKGRGAWREELDKYTKGKIQELPAEHWRAFHSFLTS